MKFELLCLLTYTASCETIYFDSFNKTLEDEALEYMDLGDVASYEFFYGFIDKSIELSDDTEELRDSKDLDFSRQEMKFTDVSPYVYEALQ